MDIIITYGQSDGVLYFGINLLVMDSIITQIIKQEYHYQAWKEGKCIMSQYQPIITILKQSNYREITCAYAVQCLLIRS